ncbi:29304_t:CDS:1, partial [Racocetra persica]
LISHPYHTEIRIDITDLLTRTILILICQTPDHNTCSAGQESRNKTFGKRNPEPVQ